MNQLCEACTPNSWVSRSRQVHICIRPPTEIFRQRSNAIWRLLETNEKNEAWEKLQERVLASYEITKRGVLFWLADSGSELERMFDERKTDIACWLAENRKDPIHKNPPDDDYENNDALTIIDSC